MSELVGDADLQAVVIRVRIASLAYDGAEHSASILRVLRVAEVQPATAILICARRRRGQDRRVDLMLVQQFDSARNHVCRFYQPVRGDLVLHLETPFLRVGRHKGRIVIAQSQQRYCSKVEAIPWMSRLERERLWNRVDQRA